MKGKKLVSEPSIDDSVLFNIEHANSHQDLLLKIYRNYSQNNRNNFIEQTLNQLCETFNFSRAHLFEFKKPYIEIECKASYPSNSKWDSHKKTIDLSNFVNALIKNSYLIEQPTFHSLKFENLWKNWYFEDSDSLIIFPVGGKKLIGFLVFVSIFEVETDKLPIELFRECLSLIQQGLEAQKISAKPETIEPIFEKLSDTILEGIAVVEKGFVRYVNKKFIAMFGYEKEEILGKSILNFIANKDKKFVKEKINSAKEDSYEVTCIKSNGQFFPVEACGKTLLYMGRKLLLCVIRDTSRDRNMATFLKDREAQYRNLFTFTNDAIFIIEPETHQILDTNEKAHELLGYDRNEYSQLRFYELDSHANKTKISGMIENMIAKENLIYEHKFVCKDGSMIVVEINARLVEQSSQKIILCFVRDVTSRKKMESELARAQRLETAGKVAGQIAHDFNNLLGPLAAYPSIIQSELPQNHPAQSMLTEMEFSANKIADINQQLLTLGRRGHYNKELINLNSILHKGILQLSQDNFTLKQELKKDLFLIEGGAAQIMRILMNLIQNSKEAIPDGGTITIKTENIHIDKPFNNQKRFKKGDYVKISISDTGIGIPANILEKIFDPFFTTKRMDKQRGTGLGLSIVHSIMDDHNGYVSVESTVNVGTTFTLFFPVSNKLNVDNVIPYLKGGHEKILIVDDDPLQRNVSTELLRRLGYKISCVSSGLKAIEFIKKTPQDIVLMDMLMAGLDGAETYRKILEHYPKQKAIIITGYSMTQQIRDALELGAGAYLTKPVTLLALGTAIRKELDRKPKQQILQ